MRAARVLAPRRIGRPSCHDRVVTVSMRCPRCKQSFEAENPEGLADDVLAHLEVTHGHAPPREHVLARIAGQNAAGEE